jgi:hypothetical protein
MIVIYTANMGGRDAPLPQVAQDVEVEWRYYTDDIGIEVPEPWERIRVRPDIAGNSNMAAKWYKTHPSLAWLESDPAIWIDASMEITSPSFAREALAALGDAPLAAWRHPRRDCIYAEAEASLGRESQGGRYDALPIREQMASYLSEGHPAHWGLWACGTIVWTEPAVALATAWWLECQRWGHQDQLSFPVVCHRADVRPAEFPITQIERVARGRRGTLENRWLRIHPHVRPELIGTH